MSPWPALGYDPVPGDPSAVRTAGLTIREAGDRAATLTDRLRSLDGGAGEQVWRGDAADLFRRLLREIGPELTRLTQAHHDASDAVVTYAGALEDAQGTARSAESGAAGASADRDSAAQTRRRWRDQAADAGSSAGRLESDLRGAGVRRLLAPGDPVYQADMDRYEAQLHSALADNRTRAADARTMEAAARTAEDAAAARVQAAHRLAEQAREMRQQAADRAVGQLDDAAGQLGDRPGLLVRLGRQINQGLGRITSNPEFGRWMQRISDAGSVLTTVGTIAAMLPIPGAQVVGGALLAAGLVAKLVALGGTAIANQYGNASGRDVLYRGLDLGLSALGAGRAVLGAGRAALGAYRVARSLGATGAPLARATLLVRGRWGGLVVNRTPGAGDLAVARRLGIPDPQRFFQVNQAVQAGGTVVGSGMEGVESARRIASPNPQRPDMTSLIGPAIGAGGGQVATVIRAPIVGGAVSAVGDPIARAATR
ncbi:hypothetical protein [Pseudonocardia broussonetiae]|uniref:WXG100 family type VII secretion target n=1 Tax=Pseudonocardia broussonetiae TaxID=2736640 RepID=A0A6M6JNC3_9PSEU|nr:hypothetical protein [Pseudonocardia broussonetiae]QJY47939.1 hypothetical protein HOP40_20825 [Pseudonocardia broussonetiae]